MNLKTQIESRLQEAAELCDEVLAGLNFDALHVNDNNATDWQDALTKLNAAYDAVKHCQRHNFPDPSNDVSEHRTYSARFGRLTC